MSRHVEESMERSAWAAAVNGPHAPFSTKALACEDVPESDIRAWRDGVKHASVPKLRIVLRRMLAQDPAAAVDFLDALLGLRDAGVIAALAPRSRVAQALAMEVLDVQAASGTLAAVTTTALADRFVSPDEAEQLTQAADALERQVAEVRALAKSAAHPSLPGVA